MGVVILNLVGVNAYVPHADGKSLLAVMPNATRLGKSPVVNGTDGQPLKRHLPLLWQRAKVPGGGFSILRPRIFSGCRLSFELKGGAPSPLNLASVMKKAKNGWVDVDPELLKPVRDDRISGQIVVRHGAALAVSNKKCKPQWSMASAQSLDQVVPKLSFRMEGVKSIKATMTSLSNGNTGVLYNAKLDEEEIELFAGNVCAEDVLEWPRSSVEGSIVDEDFRWIYGLSKSVANSLEGALPVPVLADDKAIQSDSSIEDAHNDVVWGGGGGLGCECNGCIDQPKTFKP